MKKSSSADLLKFEAGIIISHQYGLRHLRTLLDIYLSRRFICACFILWKILSCRGVNFGETYVYYMCSFQA